MSTEKYCSNCGNVIKDNANFCAACGATQGDAPAQQPAQQPVQPAGPAVAAPVGTPPSDEDKNKLILWMVASIIIPLIGIVLAIMKYNKQDKKSGMHYLLCGLSGICFGMGGFHWVGFLAGAVIVASVIYNGLRQIKAGEISLP